MTTKHKSKPKTKPKRAVRRPSATKRARSGATKVKVRAAAPNGATVNGEDRRLAKAKIFIDTLKSEFAKPNHGGGVAAVAKALNMTETAVVSRAYAYRKRGVALPKFPSGGQVYPWGALAAYAGKATTKRGGARKSAAK